MILIFLLPFVSLSTGFLLPNITLDAATYQACSTCDARADRAGNLAVAEALREFMTKNHVKLAIASGDVQISKSFGNARIDTGASCSKTAEARNIQVIARMTNDQEMLDSLAIGYEDQVKFAFLAGEVPHEVNVSASIRTWFGTKIWPFGCWRRIFRKTCPTQASASGNNKILVVLTASDISTATIAGQEYLMFVLDVTVFDETQPSSYGSMSAAKGSGCNLNVLGIKIGSINNIVQRHANSYLRSHTQQINQLRGPALVGRLERVLKARLGSTVTLPVNILGATRGKRAAFQPCQRKSCPAGFTRIGNTNRCQKPFGSIKPDCSKYGPTASIHSLSFRRFVMFTSLQLYFCHVDMV